MMMIMTSNNLNKTNPNPGSCDSNKPTSEPLHVEVVPGATVLSQEASGIMKDIIKGN